MYTWMTHQVPLCSNGAHSTMNTSVCIDCTLDKFNWKEVGDGYSLAPIQLFMVNVLAGVKTTCPDQVQHPV